MKILVRLPNWLGDLVMSTAFLNRLRETFPDAIVDVIVKEELKDLLAYMPPVRKVFPFSKKKQKGISGLYAFGRNLARTEDYDLFFSLPGSFSSLLIGFLSGARSRIGFRKGLNSIFLTEAHPTPANLHRVDDYLLLLKNFAAEKSLKGTVGLNPKNKAFQRIPGIPERYVILNAGSEAQSRRLPLEYAVGLANGLIAGLKLPIVLTGTSDAQKFCSSLMAGLKEPRYGINLTGQTSLENLVNLMHFAELVVSTDSGPAHVANALNKNLVVLFGAGNERITGPYNKTGLKLMRVNLECSPCVSNICKYGTPKCLLGINVEDIVASGREMLQNSPPR
jgi:heptosyltransferase-2